MKKPKMIRRLSDCIVSRGMCRVFMRSDGEWYTNYYPLKVNDQFFMGAVEDNFQLDGFKICPLRRVSKVKIRRDKCLDINISEGVVDSLYMPKVNISGWKQIFRSLRDMNRYVMIDTENSLYVGAILQIKNNSVTIKHFDADGIWQEEPVRIRFKDIESVSFGSRYVDIFSKYIPKL